MKKKFEQKSLKTGHGDGLTAQLRSESKTIFFWSQFLGQNLAQKKHQ